MEDKKSQCKYCGQMKHGRPVCNDCIILFTNASNASERDNLYCFGCSNQIIGNYNLRGMPDDGDTLCRKCFNLSKVAGAG